MAETEQKQGTATCERLLGMMPDFCTTSLDRFPWCAEYCNKIQPGAMAETEQKQGTATCERLLEMMPDFCTTSLDRFPWCAEYCNKFQPVVWHRLSNRFHFAVANIGLVSR